MVISTKQTLLLVPLAPLVKVAPISLRRGRSALAPTCVSGNGSRAVPDQGVLGHDLEHAVIEVRIARHNAHCVVVVRNEGFLLGRACALRQR